MYNNIFFVTVCMNQALDYFGYFMSLAINIDFDSHTFHNTLFTIHVIESLLSTSIFSLCYNVDFLHISLINFHDSCIVETYLIYVKES